MEQLLKEIMELTHQSLLGVECILKITKEMKDHIQSQDIRSLSRAVDARQIKMDQVSSTNEVIKEKTQELINMFSVHSMDDIDKEKYPQVEDIAACKSKIKELLSQAYDLEQANSKNADLLLQEYKDAIKELQVNKKAMRAYGSSPSGQSILINKVK